MDQMRLREKDKTLSFEVNSRQRVVSAESKEGKKKNKERRDGTYPALTNGPYTHNLTFLFDCGPFD